jgi:hypothetical protein
MRKTGGYTLFKQKNNDRITSLHNNTFYTTLRQEPERLCTRSSDRSTQTIENANLKEEDA